MSNKKITRDTIKEVLVEKSQSLPAIILASGQVAIQKPIQYEGFTENGVKMNRCYCHACGNHYEITASRHVTCPKCGNRTASYIALVDDRFFRPSVGDLKQWRNDRRTGGNENPTGDKTKTV